MVKQHYDYIDLANDKYAILILAHQNQVQLSRLICALEHVNIDIFIHLDKRFNIDIH